MNGLTEKQLERLERALAARHEELVEVLRAASEHSENRQYPELLGHNPPDDADASAARAEVELNLAMTDREIQEIRDIEAARERIAEGTYGACLDCGSRIPFERLLAYPTAPRCLGCQSRMERTYAHG